jgi:hypothetical protein
MTYFCLKAKILKFFTKKKKMLLSNQVHMVHPEKRKEINKYFEANVAYILCFQIKQT